MLAFPTADQARERLHPMGFAEILDTTFSLYRTHFRVFLQIIAVYFGLSILQEAVFVFLTEESPFFTNFIISCIITSFVGGALVTTSSALYLAGHAPAQAAWRRAGKAISCYRYLKCTFLWGFVAFMSFVCIYRLFTLLAPTRTLVGTVIIFLCVFPVTLYFTITWSFWGFAILIEGKSARAALKRSRQLVKNTWWSVCGITLAIYLLGLSMHMILSLSWDTLLWFTDVGEVENPVEIIRQMVSLDEPAESITLRSNPIGTLIGYALDAFVLPIVVIGSMLLYFDLRIRKEAFDLELMIRNI